jgi:hypothetical protein
MPDVPAAAALARQAQEGLNVAAYELLRSRGAVAGAASGSGLSEAMEQLTRLAGEQGQLSSDAQAVLVPGAGGALLQQLGGLAARQRALAQQLEWLHAGGDAQAAGELAEEARQLAETMEEGRLDPRTLARQQTLYRRLLDAGRSLRGRDPDERKERVARAATDSVGPRGRAAAEVPGGAGGVRYPTWDELRGLTPQERRLVLEYFRRLNAPR